LAHPKTDAFLRDLAQKRRRGLRAAAAGDWDTAIEFYSKEVEMDSEKNSAVTPNLEMGKLWNRYHLGKALYSAGRASEALPHLRYCAENGGTTFMRAGAREMPDKYEKTFSQQ
ncbi:MAG: hypothetical protein J6252_03615, partial [Clostridia bacterium]|nr:hypothetical protein [Clostridia bacterium]